jgi:hypothetical protein
MWLPWYFSPVVGTSLPVRRAMIAAVACMLVKPAEAQDIGSGRPFSPIA